MTTAIRLLPRRSAITLAATWAAVLLTLALWLTQTSQVVLRWQLMRWQFWSLEACVWLLLGLGVVVVREMWQQLRRDDLIQIGVLMSVAVTLVMFVAPRTNRIYYDEQIYQSIGQNLSDARRAQMCLDGYVEYGRLRCSIGEYNKQPYAYPHLLSLLYRVAGVGPREAFAVNAAAMALTVAAVYLVTLILFADRDAAFFAGLIVTLIPQQLLWSATAAVEPTASFACVLAFLAMALYVRSRTTVALMTAAVAAAYATQYRVESLLIIPVVGLVLCQIAGDELKKTRFWWVVLLGLVLVAVHLGHLYSVRGEGWGTTDARLSLKYVAPNFRVNGGFYAGDERFPVIYSILAVAALLVSTQVALRAAVLLYFLVFFGIGLLFYAGSYNYGADVRYSLMTYPPVAILGGLGAARVRQWLSRLPGVVHARSLVAAALVVQFLWYAPLVRDTTEEAWAARADVRSAESFAAALPPNSYVLTHNPGMFHVWGVNAGLMSGVADSNGRLQFLASRYAGGVYLHWNFWCNVNDPVQQRFCHQALSLAPTQLFREYRERDQRFALYRFVLPDWPGSGLRQGGGPP
jgi:Dolichyl-phosphate-mannose-protein mannosyltransferase